VLRNFGEKIHLEICFKRAPLLTHKGLKRPVERPQVNVKKVTALYPRQYLVHGFDIKGP
jgi:hypothetical protein